jgi:hypothetical protein
MASRPGTLVSAFSVIAVLSACDHPTIGTPPPDGADGVCCPIALGGCSYVGGYSADGNCQKWCDGCYGERITGEHGCAQVLSGPCPAWRVDAGADAASGDGAAEASVDASVDAGTDAASRDGAAEASVDASVDALAD